MKTYLICGLGNPGEKYAKTRHNVGFEAIKMIFEKEGDFTMKEAAKFESLIAENSDTETKIILCQPTTFMNKSGRALQKIKSYYKIHNENILIIYDDVDLALGEIRIRKKGGPGTHNGMKSVILELGTEDFARLRIGIGEPYPPQKDLSSYVLEPFTKKELEKVTEALNKIPEIIKTFINEGCEKAMTKWN